MFVDNKIDIIFTQIDKMGIVHNSIYPIWFEKGRRGYMKKAGLSTSSLTEFSLFLPLVQMECKYKSPARFGDNLMIRTEITEISSVKIKFEYQIMNSKSGKLIALGKTVHVWTGRSMEPVNIEKQAPGVYGRLRQFAAQENAVV